MQVSCFGSYGLSHCRKQVALTVYDNAVSHLKSRERVNETKFNG